VQTPILSAMWNDIGQRIQRAANLQIRIKAQFAPEPPWLGPYWTMASTYFYLDEQEKTPGLFPTRYGVEPQPRGAILRG
jgi:hypothetical protein